MNLSEIRFQLVDVLQIPLLSHAPRYAHLNLALVDEILSKANRLSQSTWGHSLQQIGDDELSQGWQKLAEEGWLKQHLEKSKGGMGLPLSLCTAVWEILFQAWPQLGLYAYLTAEVAALVEAWGEPKDCQVLLDDLAEGRSAGALAPIGLNLEQDQEQITLIAQQKQNQWMLSGSLSEVVGADRMLAPDCQLLAVARMGKSSEDLGLFTFSLRQKEVVITPQFKIPGLAALSNSLVTLNQPVQAKLLCPLSPGQSKTSLINHRLSSGIALFFMALSEKAYQTALESARNKKEPAFWETNPQEGQTEQPLLQHPLAAEALTSMKALSEGMRGACYSQAFFLDCLEQAGGSQQGYFADLVELYSMVLKAYNFDAGQEVLKEAFLISHLTEDKALLEFEQNIQSLLAGAHLGQAGRNLAARLQHSTLQKDEGRVLHNLMQQFEMLEAHHAKTGALKEAIGVWRDYLGALLLLAADIKAKEIPGEQKGMLLYSKKLLLLIGDLLLGYHLIRSGVEAEKQLKKLGANFYSLPLDAARSEEVKIQYNRLLTAEYFCLNILSQQEGIIRIIQRGGTSALEMLF